MLLWAMLPKWKWRASWKKYTKINFVFVPTNIWSIHRVNTGLHCIHKGSINRWAQQSRGYKDNRPSELQNLGTNAMYLVQFRTQTYSTGHKSPCLFLFPMICYSKAACKSLTLAQLSSAQRYLQRDVRYEIWHVTRLYLWTFLKSSCRMPN